MKKALIAGVTGQDGAYLAELLLAKGYEVHGIKRRYSIFNTARMDHLHQNLQEGEQKFILHHGDLSHSTHIMRVVQEVLPDEIYNLGAMGHVQEGVEEPEYVAGVDGLGTLLLLEAVRSLGLKDKTKVYQASTSELYGLVQGAPHTEKTPFYPRPPYGVSKLYAYWITVHYREAYHIFACNGTLFNHESPLRGETFVTRKITRAVAKIALGLQTKLFLGNLDARHDWGHARDYADAMWRALQQPTPEDYVIATGIPTSVRDFVRMAFSEVGVELDFQGEGAQETGIISKVHTADFPLGPGTEVVAVDPRYYRPTEVDLLLGEPEKAKTKLGWEPRSTLSDMVHEMVTEDIAYFRFLVNPDG